jgi:dephospho-CoA kinase
MGRTLNEGGINLLVIGLTGGIASGKSTVSLLLKQKGAVIIDADKISRQVMLPGKEAWFEIKKHFGDEILCPDGKINRKKLGSLVFSDKKKLKILNGITHPKIIDEIKNELLVYKRENQRVVVIDAALLLEVGLDSYVDEVWVVTVDEKTQIQRLMNREKNMTVRQAINRIRAQMPLEEKLKFAKRIIDNSSDIAHTKRQVEKIWEDLSIQ